MMNEPMAPTVETVTDEDDSIMQTQAAAKDSRFCCNICLEAVQEPVVTRCGHLYCWPCLYRWLEPGMLPAERRSLGVTFPLRQLNINESRRVCPVCKAACSVPTLVPIYVRNSEESFNISPSQSSVRSNDSHKTRESNNNNSNNDLHEVSTPTISNVGEVDEHVEDIDDIDGIDDIDDVPTSSATTGLRQRHQARSSTTNERQDVMQEMEQLVPARPTPPPPTATTTTTAANEAGMNNNTVWSSSSMHRATLSNGLTSSVQQALLTGMGGISGGANPAASDGAIPSIHRRDGETFSGSHMPMEMEQDSDSTEFLSRLLLMLGSFVIFCLLLF